jgi:hypothetical protein
MLSKSFEVTIPFIHTPEGLWEPLLQVTILKPNPRKLDVPLLFDTGADQILLHPYWEFAFPHGLSPHTFVGIGGDVKGKYTRGQIQLLGRTIDCNIGFGPPEMAQKTWMAGILGRECFKSFGFGFWERARQLYVTAKP